MLIPRSALLYAHSPSPLRRSVFSFCQPNEVISNLCFPISFYSACVYWEHALCNELCDSREGERKLGNTKVHTWDIIIVSAIFYSLIRWIGCVPKFIFYFDNFRCTKNQLEQYKEFLDTLHQDSPNVNILLHL